MREILFRGKRVDNEHEWVCGNYHNHSSEKSISFYKVFVGTAMTMYAVIPETVGEYTGLTDKNDARIFEGDVIKHEGENFIVYWNEECAGFYPFYDQDHPTGYGVIGEESEVIGNVHDNLELLKGE